MYCGDPTISPHSEACFIRGEVKPGKFEPFKGPNVLKRRRTFFNLPKTLRNGHTNIPGIGHERCPSSPPPRVTAEPFK